MESINDFLKINCGSSFGYGYGGGSGSGDGYGGGFGYGYGGGSGSGSGSGFGFGYGYGDGIKTINGYTVVNIDDIQTAVKRTHGNVMQGWILKSDLTMVPCYVVKSDPYFAHGDTFAAARAALNDKIMGGKPLDERISEFWSDHPSKTKKYPVSDMYRWHHILTGSCEMGRKAFANDHNIDIDNDVMTIDEFIEITQNSFGGDIIKRLKS